MALIFCIRSEAQSSAESNGQGLTEGLRSEFAREAEEGEEGGIGGLVRSTQDERRVRKQGSREG